MSNSIAITNMPFFKMLYINPLVKWYTVHGENEGHFFTVDMNRHGIAVTVYDDYGHCMQFNFSYVDTFSMGNAHDAVCASFMLMHFCKRSRKSYQTRAANGCYSSLKSINLFNNNKNSMENVYVRDNH